MSEKAPERIWAWYGTGHHYSTPIRLWEPPYLWKGEVTGPEGQEDDLIKPTEYIRADVHEAVVKERDRYKLGAEAVIAKMSEEAARARAMGITFEAVRDVLARYEQGEISFGRAVEELQTLALHGRPEEQ